MRVPAVFLGMKKFLPFMVNLHGEPLRREESKNKEFSPPASRVAKAMQDKVARGSQRNRRERV